MRLKLDTLSEIRKEIQNLNLRFDDRKLYRNTCEWNRGIICDGGCAYISPNEGRVVRLFGDSRVQKYVWLPISALRAAGANAATIGLNGNGWIVASFADNLTRVVQGNMMIPDDIDVTEDINVCLGWSSPTVSQNCDWVVGYLITAVDESTEQAATNIQGFEESSAVADGLVRSLFTIDAGLYDANDLCLHLTITRDGGDVGDTLGDIAELHGIALLYTANKLGT